MCADFAVGKWHVDSQRGQIAAEGEESQLEPRVMDLLVYLAEHSDEVLSKERLIQAIWPDTFVSDEVLTSAIWKLRHALGDDPKNPTYIRTLPRRGYQLVSEVVFPEEADSDGGRYELVRKLGEGGMGEVFLARDTELGRRLVLKFVRPEQEADETSRRRLRREARAAALLDHPFICKVYDTGRLNGRDFIAMEYIEGERLSDRVRSGPLPLGESLRVGIEMLEALEAAHRHGIVHRDIKPSNVFLTGQGHVKITDFGIAKKIRPVESGEADWTQTEATIETTGTPGYMSPEQIRQEPVDHRTDLFLFGIVLYEMLTGVHPFRRKTEGETMAAILHESPRPPSDYLEGVHLQLLDETVQKLLARKPDARYQLAHHARSRLQAMVDQSASGEMRFMGRLGVPAERIEAAEEIPPYPGLAAFTAAQSSYFFGRDSEVEALWQKLSHSSLLAVIGPSGGGKSSFLRAGVAPAAPEGWGVLIATPGNRPFLGLAQALSEQLPADPETVRQLLRFEDPEVAIELFTQWRRQCGDALIVLDQFEELFTLTPQQTCERFVHLLDQLVIRAKAHLLISMRDDFLFRCHGIRELEPVFQDVTPIGPLTGGALKQALVGPADKCGFRFADESLVAEILATTEGEPGALPMLAFAARQLWEKRDIERKLLTREAYQSIGGVEGALAGHAEATLAGIASDQRPLARELFRNLITARGTRSVQNREELLSVFDEEQRDAAAQVLDVLIDARLLVSFRLPSLDPEQEGEQRVEIVHDSLLTNWPRLVRWQTQDAGSAQLRDELHQAARLWDQHGRSPDFLWSGTAFKEYELWREHYPGGLTELEEQFGGAMSDFNRRRAKRRRMAIAAVIFFLSVGIASISIVWRQSLNETRRAEAATLLALAQTNPESDPTSAVAYVTKSLELADSEFARHLVTRILSQGPIAFTRATEGDAVSLAFSPDGKALVAGGHLGLHEVWHSNGSPPVRLTAHGDKGVYGNSFSRDGRFLVSLSPLGGAPGGGNEAIIWDFTRLTPIQTVDPSPHEEICCLFGTGWLHPNGLPVYKVSDGNGDAETRLIPFDGGSPERFGNWPSPGDGRHVYRFGHDSSQMVQVVDERFLYLVTGLPDHPSAPRKFGELQDREYLSAFISQDLFATCDWSYRIDIWSLSAEAGSPVRTFQGPEEIINSWAFDPQGRWLATPNGTLNQASVWDLSAEVSRGPQVLRHGDRPTSAVAVHPDGIWVAVADSPTISLWPLRHRYPSLLYQGEDWLMGLCIDPNGEWVATTGIGGLRIWSLKTSGSGYPKLLYEFAGFNWSPPAVSPDGESIAFRAGQKLLVIPTSGGPMRELDWGTLQDISPILISSVAFDHGGTRLAAAGLNRVQVWNLETGEMEGFESDAGSTLLTLQFGPDGRLYASGPEGLWSWNLTTGDAKLLIPGKVGELSPDGRYFLGFTSDPTKGGGDATVYDLETGDNWRLPALDGTARGAWDPSGKIIVTSDMEGTIRVSSFDGGIPHLLFGHTAWARVAVHPSGKWILSASRDDGTLRLWPMPDVSKPPFYALPHDELVARLKSMTNYEVLEDESSHSGYRIEFGPFPGWETVPEW